jgi:hypothetical protein
MYGYSHVDVGVMKGRRGVATTRANLENKKRKAINQEKQKGFDGSRDLPSSRLGLLENK